MSSAGRAASRPSTADPLEDEELIWTALRGQVAELLVDALAALDDDADAGSEARRDGVGDELDQAAHAGQGQADQEDARQQAGDEQSADAELLARPVLQLAGPLIVRERPVADDRLQHALLLGHVAEQIRVVGRDQFGEGHGAGRDQDVPDGDGIERRDAEGL